MNTKRSQSSVEIIHPWVKSEFKIQYALFDFDGTISLIREGWQDIMIPYFCEILRDTNTSETCWEIKETVKRFVTDLTGKQTIFQCIRLDEEVTKRGGPKRDPITYKREYLRRLELHIKDRKARLAAGTLDPEEYLVPGSRQFLTILQSRGIKCYLASGTDEADVLYEAKLLGIENMFEGGIHGAHDDMTECSKELVIRSMLQNEHIRPEELVSFGDGYVEVELVANLGGLAIGAATEEKKRSGINEWKRSRLVAAGARAIIPDFVDSKAVYELIY
jgi:phosphoglycolate phosphatase-like HAD superfamily hydrolase